MFSIPRSSNSYRSESLSYLLSSTGYVRFEYFLATIELSSGWTFRVWTTKHSSTNFTVMSSLLHLCTSNFISNGDSPGMTLMFEIWSHNKCGRKKCKLSRPPTHARSIFDARHKHTSREWRESLAFARVKCDVMYQEKGMKSRTLCRPESLTYPHQESFVNHT